MRSRAPTDAPPERSTASQLERSSREARGQRGASSGRLPPGTSLAAGARNWAASATLFTSRTCPGRGAASAGHELVARGEDADARAAVDVDLGDPEGGEAPKS